MESRKPKIFDPEIQKQIRDNEKSVEEQKLLIQEAMVSIKEGIEILDSETGYLEHMESEKDFTTFEKEIMGIESAPKYSTEQIEKSKLEIEKIKSDIGKLRSQIDEMTLQNIHLDAINDEWKELQQKFNEILLRVDNARQN